MSDAVNNLAMEIGSMPNKVRLGLFGLMMLLLGWFLFFAYMRSGLGLKEALYQSIGFFWLSTTLMAPVLYDMVCRALRRAN